MVLSEDKKGMRPLAQPENVWGRSEGGATQTYAAMKPVSKQFFYWMDS